MTFTGWATLIALFLGVLGFLSLRKRLQRVQNQLSWQDLLVTKGKLDAATSAVVLVWHGNNQGLAKLRVGPVAGRRRRCGRCARLHHEHATRGADRRGACAALVESCAFIDDSLLEILKGTRVSDATNKAMGALQIVTSRLAPIVARLQREHRRASMTSQLEGAQLLEIVRRLITLTNAAKAAWKETDERGTFIHTTKSGTLIRVRFASPSSLVVFTRGGPSIEVTRRDGTTLAVYTRAGPAARAAEIASGIYSEAPRIADSTALELDAALGVLADAIGVSPDKRRAAFQAVLDELRDE